MYLTLVFLPLLSSLLGLAGRKLGRGLQYLSVTCLITAALLTVVAFYEVAVCGSSVSIHVADWISLGLFEAHWSFLFDPLSVSMLLAVLGVSSMVHLFTIGYMGEDPHYPRFFSYLSLFTFFMLILVTGDNYLVLFVGWEGIGVVSFLLISFWHTRLAAAKSALQAFLVNRAGDTLFTIGLFGVAMVSLEYGTFFTTAGFLNEGVLTVIGFMFLGAAMGKSAQVPLHVWLPNAMEGFYKL